MFVSGEGHLNCLAESAAVDAITLANLMLDVTPPPEPRTIDLPVPAETSNSGLERVSLSHGPDPGVPR